MSNFSFPPPPPPPPKATPDWTAVPAGVRGGRGGFRGRGRGNQSRGNRDGSFDSRRSNPSATGYLETDAKASYGQHGQHQKGFNASHAEERGLQRRPFGNFRGQKRKRDDYSAPSTTHNRPRIDVAPEVPSFGAPLPLSSPGEVSLRPYGNLEGSGMTVSVKPKRKSNQLGLTPLGENEEPSDEEDDEAAMRAAGSQSLQIEYKGATVELGTPSAMAAWIAERRAKWPTAARVAEKKREQLRNEQESLRRKLEDGKARRAARPEMEAENRPTTTDPVVEDRATKVKRSLEKHAAKVERLKMKLEKTEAKASAAAARASSTLPDPSESARLTPSQEATGEDAKTRSVVDVAREGEALAESSSVPSSSEDSSGSESDSETGSSSDMSGPPETESSKIAEPSPVAHDVKKAPQVCRQFSMRGRCPRGKNCHFKHERKVDKAVNKPQQSTTNSKRKSLYQRLVEQEQEAEYRQALALTKYMGENGYLNAP